MAQRTSIHLANATVRALQNGSLEENLAEATRNFKLAKDEDMILKEDGDQYLDEAIKQYNFALQKEGLSQETRVITKLQLGKAHGNRAILALAAPESSLRDPFKISEYHIKQAAVYLVEYSNQGRALSLPSVQEKLDKVSIDLLMQCSKVLNQPRHRIHLAKCSQLHLLGGLASEYKGPQLPRARLELYIAQEYFKLAMRHLDQSMELGAPFAEMDKLSSSALKWRTISKEDSEVPNLRGWLECLQCIIEASRSLSSAKVHIEREASNNDDKTALYTQLTGLADSVRFCWQRGRVVIQLAACHEDLYRATKGSETFDFQQCLDLCDSIRDAHRKATNFEALGESWDVGALLNSRGVDVEMECVTLHVLAVVFDLMGLKERARELHKRVVVQALSLDPSVYDYDDPTPFLRQRKWFMKSRTYVQDAQARDQAKEDAERDAALNEIQAHLVPIKQARDEGLKPFLKYVYAKHPPKNNGRLDDSVNADSDIPKVKFLKMLRDYHTDKLPADTDRGEKLLYEEISKYFNHFYEQNFK